MKVENQICTIEQARKLKALGITQGVAYFYFYQDEKLKESGDVRVLSQAFDSRCENCFDAFNVAELGEMLDYGTFCYRKREAIHRANCLIMDLEMNITTPEKVNDKIINS